MSKPLQKFLVFTLTFLAYAGLHCLREGWSYSKKQIQKQFSITSPQFGLIDTLYLFFYSIGMASIGNLTTRINLTIFVGVGMILSCAFYMSFALGFALFNQFAYIAMLIAMCFNGFFQSTGWPGVIGIVGNWFGKGKRGLLMGFWACNSNVGNIIGLVLCNVLDQSNQLSWVYNFFVTGGFALAIAIFCLIFLDQKPKTEQADLRQELTKPEQINNQPLLPESQKESTLTQQQPNSHSQSPKSIIISQQSPTPQKQLTVLTALFLPRVPFYVIGYSMTKGCIYGLLFWLPTYLDNKGLTHEKGYISSMVDVGTFIGSLVVGYLGDVYSCRALFIPPLFACAAVIMFIVSFALTDSPFGYYVCLFLIGLMMGGPYIIIGSAIAMDLGEQAGKKNIAKVSALIEGSAAIFAAVSQIAISYMPFGGIFYLFCGECLVGALALLPLMIKDVKELRKKLVVDLVEEVH